MWFLTQHLVPSNKDLFQLERKKKLFSYNKNSFPCLRSMMHESKMVTLERPHGSIFKRILKIKRHYLVFELRRFKNDNKSYDCIYSIL